MSTHFCKVGTVRPNLNKVEDSMAIEHNSIELKAEKPKPYNKSTE